MHVRESLGQPCSEQRRREPSTKKPSAEAHHRWNQHPTQSQDSPHVSKLAAGILWDAEESPPDTVDADSRKADSEQVLPQRPCISLQWLPEQNPTGWGLGQQKCVSHTSKAWRSKVRVLAGPPWLADGRLLPGFSRGLSFNNALLIQGHQ